MGTNRTESGIAISAACKQPNFQALRVRVVNLKDPHGVKSDTSISRSVESRAENYVLRNAAGDTFCQLIFRVTAADSHERTEVPRPPCAMTRRICVNFSNRVSNNANCQRVIQNFRSIEQLMRRPAKCHAEVRCGLGRFLHQKMDCRSGLNRQLQCKRRRFSWRVKEWHRHNLGRNGLASRFHRQFHTQS